MAGSYQQVTKGAEMRQRALDIFWTFFIENAVSEKLHVVASLYVCSYIMSLAYTVGSKMVKISSIPVRGQIKGFDRSLNQL